MLIYYTPTIPEPTFGKFNFFSISKLVCLTNFSFFIIIDAFRMIIPAKYGLPIVTTSELSTNADGTTW